MIISSALDVTFHRVTRETYSAALALAWDAREEIRAAVTPEYRDPTRVPITTACYLATDGLSGFLVKINGEIAGVWSLVRGRGDKIVEAAIDAGGDHLDCFDGYLPRLYGRHGFRETSREPNWTPGGPDVVFMHLCSTLCVADTHDGA